MRGVDERLNVVSGVRNIRDRIEHACMMLTIII